MSENPDFGISYASGGAVLRRLHPSNQCILWDLGTLGKGHPREWRVLAGAPPGMGPKVHQIWEWNAGSAWHPRERAPPGMGRFAGAPPGMLGIPGVKPREEDTLTPTPCGQKLGARQGGIFQKRVKPPKCSPPPAAKEHHKGDSKGEGLSKEFP